ncbi:hypothetical protein V0Q12_04410 [Limosilactobacillus reuteri]|jgi:U3 small nucleolar RNA-associated protein 14|nr:MULTISPECIES: hypothetical protein [Limosilactobacillus]MDE7039463.1 hypothetical protein [Limosilactobacillus sp.]PEG89526.1 hypothetical protein CP364_01825 [Lactobacillus sp. UMNPBX13]PEG95453.1 hypothetical protein CP361_00400 [Lactobacillus sp. UMNPBX10]PEH00705.1 hypothetical protein CP358_04550 [Lactobacillus sp. UMNPBX7]PEH07695.1 hypothetical protein CP354_07640 [Lactobacillus sp. UMNPBX3]HIY93022.1 hypothetical protein [Candidatus Companilactobacillus pullicola]
MAKGSIIMEINADALKNFQDSKFNFVDADGNDVDFDNLDESVKYTLRDGETVVEDDMHAKDVVDTINNEYGKTMNV